MVKFVPEVRFPEFKSDWKLKNLKDVFELKYGKDHKNLNSGKYPMLGTGGIMRFVDSYLYDQQSVLIGRKGTIDKPRFIDEPFWTVDTLFYTIIKPTQVPYFVYCLAQKINWYKYNEATGVPSLNSSGIYSVPVRIPSKVEQQKISDVLASIDTKISQLTEKHRLLKEYKKGVMQQLFGQTISFKDDEGKAFPEWVEDRLDSFIKRVNDPVDVEQATEYRQIGIRCHGKGVFHKEEVTGTELGNKRVFWVHPKALIINIVFAWERAVAVTTDNEQGFIASHRFPMFVPVEGKSDLDYLLYFLLSPRGEYLLNLASPGGAGRNKTLGQAEFAKLKVKLPSLAEQKKIAQFLQSVDKKIEAVAEQIEQTKLFKKGLLQQMFV